MATRVALADDHPIVLAGIRAIVTRSPDLTLVGEATSGFSALRLIRESQPDVAVLDLSLPEMGGTAVAKQVRIECPSVRLIALTAHEDRARVQEALAAGMCGYVLKRSVGDVLVHAIRAVAVAGLYVDPAASRHFLETHQEPSRKRIEECALSDREFSVLKLSAQGYSAKEIASQLVLSVKSVETYKGRAIEKTGLQSRRDLIRYAANSGWLQGM